MSPLLAEILLLLAGLVAESSSGSLSEFHWSFDVGNNSTSLTICSADQLLDQGDVVDVTLIVQVSGTTDLFEYNGALVDDYCAAFSVSWLLRLPSDDSLYSLLIAVSVEGSLEAVTRSASFAMAVKTTTIRCSDKALTRALAPPNTTFEDCLSDSFLVGNVCYIEGDLTSSPLCFTRIDSNPSGVRVCLNGSSPKSTLTNDDLAINFLAYSSSSLSDPTVTLDVTGGEPSNEAVFWKDGVVHSISHFFERPWYETSFTPHFAEYAVCVIVMDQDNQPVTSSAASVTDLAVRVSHSVNRIDEVTLLQFSFTNANPQRSYRASVWSSFPTIGAPLEADPLDCADVDHNSTCFRFMEYAGTQKDVFVTIEYSDPAEGAVENMVVMPYTIAQLINPEAKV